MRSRGNERRALSLEDRDRAHMLELLAKLSKTEI